MDYIKGIKDYYKVFAFIFFAICYNVTYAQMACLYTTKSGLTSSDINSIDVDSKGLAWISGAYSLDIFDGSKFVNLNTILSKGDKLPFNSISKVVEHKEDEYWFITSNGLFLYNGKQNTLEHKALMANEDSLGGLPLNCMIDYNKPNLKLISTDGNGVFVFNTETQTVDTAQTKQLKKALPDIFTNRMLIDSDGYLWANAIFRRLFRINLKTMKPEEINITPEATNILRNGNVTCIIQHRKSKNIIITTEVGIVIYDYKTKTLRTTTSPAISSMTITTIFEDADGKILVGTDNRGLWRLDEHETLLPFPNCDPTMNIEFAKVRSFATDSEGNLIIAMAQKGVFVVPHTHDKFSYHSFSPTSNKMNATSVTSIAIDAYNNFWVGTDGCGVFKLNTNNFIDQTTHYSQGLGSSLVQSVVIDKRQTVWAGSYGGGIQCLAGDKFVTPEWLRPLASSYIKTLRYNAERDLLFIGSNGQGVYVADLANHTLTNLNGSISINGWVYALHCDNKGILWIGTARGIYMYDLKGKAGHEVKFPNSQTLVPHCITTYNNHLLIGTNKGLVSYDIVSTKSSFILAGENIKAIELSDHDIWVTTAKDIIRVDKQTNECRRYTSFGGYYMGDFHNDAHCLSSSKELFFGGDNGIIGLNTSYVREPRRINHDIFFSSVQIDGQLVCYDAESDDNVMDANFIATTKLNLAHDQNTITIGFGVPDFAAPTRLRYKYILEGYDKLWHMDVTIPEVTYTNLPSGSYKLRVVAYYENDTENTRERVLEIHISEPWYNTWVAWLIYIILLGAVSYHLRQVIMERRRQARLLEDARQNEQVKEAKLQMFTSIAHELRSPLTMIVSPLRQLISTTDDADVMGMYTTMQRNCDRMLSTLKQITDIRKIDNGQFRLHFSEVDFVSYCDYIFESFATYATAKHINFSIEHNNQNINLWLDKIHFEKILSNILSNAFKFTPDGGNISITSKCILHNSADWLEIKLYNDGPHISKGDLPHIFERFYQADNTTTESQGSGIGLNLASELVRLHHGNINVHNVEPDGVEFIMAFPLGNKHLTEFDMQPRNDEVNEEETSDKELFKEIINENIEETSTSTPQKRMKKVLIVDDDISLCQYVMQQLKDDFNVTTAYSGNTAWEEILKNRPDAVVTDIQMPDGNGIELCKRIKGNPDTDNTPIIMLTSESNDRAQILSLSLQVDHFLVKPFNMLMLKSAIKQSINIREKMMGRMRRSEVDFDYSAKEFASSDDKLFVRINAALKKNLDDSTFGVNELAEEVGISRVHLNRKMKERYSMSPINFIRSYRLKQSAYLLINNTVNVSEVVYRVGFSSHSHFSNSFHEYFGMTPREFIAYYTAHPDDEKLKKLLE